MHISPNPEVHAEAPIRLGLVLFAMSIGAFAIGTTEFAAMSLLPYFAADLGLTKPAAGHVISAYALGVVVGAPILAVWGARYPRKHLLVGFMAVFCVANLFSAVAPGYMLLVLSRFLSGLPHGAYFGVVALTAASLVPRNERSRAIVLAMMGLTVATVIGVPAADMLGQYAGWRWGFGLVAVLALVTVLMIRRYVPLDVVMPGKSGWTELRALKNRRVWLTLGISAIGFGGVFAVYTFLSSTLLQVTGVTGYAVSLVFGVFGLGMTVGALVIAHYADRRGQMATAGWVLVWSMVAMSLYPMATASLWTLMPVVFCIGCGAGLGAALQVRLMDVAGEAQTLAAALNHSAFNFANALGPFLAGIALSQGYGLPSTGYVGLALTFGGFVIWAIALWESRIPDACEDPCVSG